MLVKCEINELQRVSNTNTRKRLGESIHLESLREYIEVGEIYEVQAIEYMRDGVWLYLHTDPESVYPVAQPAELFSIADPTIPESWQLSWSADEGDVKLKRLSFREWVEDDYFYQDLVNGGQEAVEVYERNRR